MKADFRASGLSKTWNWNGNCCFQWTRNQNLPQKCKSSDRHVFGRNEVCSYPETSAWRPFLNHTWNQFFLDSSNYQGSDARVKKNNFSTEASLQLKQRRFLAIEKLSIEFFMKKMTAVGLEKDQFDCREKTQNKNWVFWNITLLTWR